MTNRTRYTVDNVASNVFYQMPKFLFRGDLHEALSNDAKVLYSLLRDRHELSLQNGWVNANREVYLIYTREDMCSMLGCSYNTAKKAIDQLKKYGLMEEERVGLNRPNQIFLTAVTLDNSGVSNIESPESQNLKVRTLNSCESRVSKSESQESQILRASNININNTDFNDTNLSIIRDPDTIDDDHTYTIEEKVAANIGYDLQEPQNNSDLMDNIYRLIVDVLTTQKATIRVQGEDKPAAVVQSAFLKLDSSHVEYVIEAFRQTKTKANNVRAYLVTSLYNAPMTMTAFYENWVRHDKAAE